MSSPARGSRTPRRDPDTPSRRSTRRTPSRVGDEDPPRTPSQRTPAKRKATPSKSDGVDGTPMRWGTGRQNGHGDPSSDIPATSPAPNVIPTSPAARKNDGYFVNWFCFNVVLCSNWYTRDRFKFPFELWHSEFNGIGSYSTVRYQRNTN